MDLSIILEETQPASFEFCGQQVNIEIYTAGRSRLPTSVNAAIRVVSDSEELDRYTKLVQNMKLMLPHVVKSWDVLVKGEPLPMEGELFDSLPIDALLWHISSKCNELWQNPTNAVVSPNTTALSQSEPPQTETVN